MDAASAARLLDELCTALGLCLTAAARHRLLEATPETPEAFTRAVFAAEGLDEALVDRRLARQVRARVADAFAAPATPR